jgi:hypothetical protein
MLQSPMMTPLLLQAELEAMALEWSKFHLSAEATEKQQEKYKDLYLKQIGVKMSKRETERGYKKRVQDLFDDDNDDKPKAKAAKRPASSCCGSSSGSSSIAVLQVVLSRDRGAVRKCKKLIADLETELQRAKARLPDLEASLQRSESELAAARSEEHTQEDEKPEADADQDGDSDTDLRAHVKAIIEEKGLDNLTAKSVRIDVEGRLGLEEGALKPRKQEISELIDDVIKEIGLNGDDEELIDVTGDIGEQEDTTEQQTSESELMSQQLEHLSVEKVISPSPLPHHRYPITATPSPLPHYRYPITATPLPIRGLRSTC